jgi:hypothetical protein
MAHREGIKSVASGCAKSLAGRGPGLIGHLAEGVAA